LAQFAAGCAFLLFSRRSRPHTRKRTMAVLAPGPVPPLAPGVAEMLGEANSHIWLVVPVAALVALAMYAGSRQKNKGTSGTVTCSDTRSRGLTLDNGEDPLSAMPWSRPPTADAQQSSEVRTGNAASRGFPVPTAEGASDGPAVVVVVCETVTAFHEARACIQRFPSERVADVPAELRWKVARQRGLRLASTAASAGSPTSRSASPERSPTRGTTGTTAYDPKDKLATGDERPVLDQITNDETTFFKVADGQWVPRSYAQHTVCELFDGADGKEMLRIVHPKGASFRDDSLQRRRDPRDRSQSPTRSRGEKFDEGTEFVSFDVASDKKGNPMLQVREDGWLPETLKMSGEDAIVDVCCRRVGQVQEALPAWAEVVRATNGNKVAIVNMYVSDAATVESLQAASVATEWAAARFVTPQAQDAVITELASRQQALR